MGVWTMLKYIIKRLLWIIPVLIGVTVIVFTILYFSPGDTAYLARGDNATPEAVDRMVEQDVCQGSPFDCLDASLQNLRAMGACQL